MRSWLWGLLGAGFLVLTGCLEPERQPLEVRLLPPASAMPAPGQWVQFRVVARSSHAPIRYQWSKDGVALAGAQGDTFTLPAVALADEGIYVAAVSDGETEVLTDPYLLEPRDACWVVWSDADSGPGTLREALDRADGLPGNLGIRFDLRQVSSGFEPLHPTIHLLSGLPPIHAQVTILGPGPVNTSGQFPGLTLDGGGTCRPFFLDGGTLTLDNFTVANGLAKGGNGPGGGGGAAGMGGGLFINAGAATLKRMVFLGNQAVGGDSAPGGDGEQGGGGGFGGDAPATGGQGGPGGFLRGTGGTGHLDGSGDGGPAFGGDGAGGGACRGGMLDQPLASWLDNLPAGDGSWGGGGGFSVGPEGGGGKGSSFGGGGGGSGGNLATFFLAGAAPGENGLYGGAGGLGDGVGAAGLGGGGGGLGGAIFLRKGTLDLLQCRFTDNHARPGRGFEAGLGKAGAIFIFPYDKNATPFDPGILLAQTYAGNTAPDAGLEDPAWDNEDFYIAHSIQAYGFDPVRDALYRRHGMILRQLLR